VTETARISARRLGSNSDPSRVKSECYPGELSTEPKPRGYFSKTFPETLIDEQDAEPVKGKSPD
jgi:hypothetical protein